jgi:hypothetical protein
MREKVVKKKNYKEFSVNEKNINFGVNEFFLKRRFKTLIFLEKVN